MTLIECIANIFNVLFVASIVMAIIGYNVVSKLSKILDELKELRNINSSLEKTLTIMSARMDGKNDRVVSSYTDENRSSTTKNSDVDFEDPFVVNDIVNKADIDGFFKDIKK